VTNRNEDENQSEKGRKMCSHFGSPRVNEQAGVRQPAHKTWLKPAKTALFN
jgi:hypothetical protein